MTSRRFLASLGLLILVSGLAHAEPPRRTANTVEFASVDVKSASNCEQLILTVRRETFPDAVETRIQHYFLIDVCTSPPGGTPLAFGEDILIPDEDFTIRRRQGTAHLRTSVPPEVFGLLGTLDLTWTMNAIANESFAGKGTRTFLSGETETAITRQMLKQTRDERSADVTGTAFGIPVSGLGGFGWTTLTAIEK